MHKKLTKADPDFYRKIGARGGKHTQKKLGSKHYAKIARLAHASRANNSRLEKKKSGSKISLRERSGSGKGTKGKRS